METIAILASWTAIQLTIAYLIWNGNYSAWRAYAGSTETIAYLIWNGNYSVNIFIREQETTIAYLIWNGNYSSIIRHIDVNQL